MNRVKVRAAAQYLGIGTRHLHDLSRQGLIPYYRISPRCIVYEIDDLDSFLANCRIE